MNIFSKIATLTSLLLALPMHAQIYTWTDENGKKHYSDRPIASEKVTKAQIAKGNHLSLTVSADSQWQKDYQAEKKNKAEKAKEKRELAKKKQPYCQDLRNRLTLYKQGGRFITLSEQGEREYLTDEQINDQKAELNKALKANCKGV